MSNTALDHRQAPASKFMATLGDLEWFRKHAREAGGGNYQTLINSALREFIASKHEPLEATLRRVLREELPTELKRATSR